MRPQAIVRGYKRVQDVSPSMHSGTTEAGTSVIYNLRLVVHFQLSPATFNCLGRDSLSRRSKICFKMSNNVVPIIYAPRGRLRYAFPVGLAFPQSMIAAPPEVI